MILFLSSHGWLEGSDQGNAKCTMTLMRSVVNTPVPGACPGEFPTPAPLQCLCAARQ